MADEPTTYRPRCMNLTCKSMRVYGEDFESDPEYQAGMVELTCIRTSRGHGPDGEDVSLGACSDPERSCFQEY
jgi:hypothetical protein